VIHTSSMLSEHRLSPREPLALPVVLEGGQSGVTRNISASGVLFEIDQAQQVDSVVDFEILLDTPEGPLRLVAHGKVVRIDTRDGRTRVAVTLIDSRLEPGSH
jgi:hypothetical protein